MNSMNKKNLFPILIYIFLFVKRVGTMTSMQIPFQNSD